MSLLDFVEQDNRIRFATYGFGKLATLIVAHVSRRRSDQTAHGVLLLILGHINTSHHILVIEEVIGQSLCQFGFTDTGSTQEDERTYRTFRVAKTGTTAAYCIGHGADSGVLTHYSFVKFILKQQQFGALALYHLAYRYSCPAANHIGDVIGINLFLDKSFLTLHSLQLSLNAYILIFLLLDGSVADLGHTCIVAFTLGSLGIKVELFDIDLVFLNAIYQVFFGLPLSRDLVLLFAHRSQIFLNVLDASLVTFTLDGFALYFFLGYLTLYVIQGLRLGINFQLQFRCSLIHQVYGFIRQKPIGDISFAQLNGCHNGFVTDTYMVVILVAFLQATKYGYGAGFIRLVNHYLLETAFESLVFLKILLILIQGGSTYAAQFATRQCRF